MLLSEYPNASDNDLLTDREDDTVPIDVFILDGDEVVFRRSFDAVTKSGSCWCRRELMIRSRLFGLHGSYLCASRDASAMVVSLSITLTLDFLCGASCIRESGRASANRLASVMTENLVLIGFMGASIKVYAS